MESHRRFYFVLMPSIAGFFFKSLGCPGSQTFFGTGGGSPEWAGTAKNNKRMSRQFRSKPHSGVQIQHHWVTIWDGFKGIWIIASFVGGIVLPISVLSQEWHKFAEIPLPEFANPSVVQAERCLRNPSEGAAIASQEPFPVQPPPLLRCLGKALDVGSAAKQLYGAPPGGAEGPIELTPTATT